MRLLLYTVLYPVFTFNYILIFLHIRGILKTLLFITIKSHALVTENLEDID